jgi:hypothetical protein
MAHLVKTIFKWVSIKLGALQSFLSAQFMQASVPSTVAFVLMCLTAMAAFQFNGDPLLVVLCIVIGNAFIQMCIDYFPSDIKPRFSALARIIPVVAAVIAYLLSRMA